MRFALIALIIALAGCGGSDSGATITDSTQIVGTWNGTTTVGNPTTGQTTTAASTLPITTTVAGQVLLGGVCLDQVSGPAATLNTTTSFTVASFNCPPSAVNGCSSVTLAISSGTGSISGGTLTMNLAATLSGCGSSGNITVNLLDALVPPAVVAVGVEIDARVACRRFKSRRSGHHQPALAQNGELKGHHAFRRAQVVLPVPGTSARC
jgi:predicted small lipoprotein YifL